MIKDLVSTTRKEVIDVILAAEDYGYDRSVLMVFLFELLGFNLTPEEIEEFSKNLASEEGYTEEDYIHGVETLNKYAQKYNK